MSAAKIVSEIEARAGEKSTATDTPPPGKCAEVVRQAIEAATGVTLARQNSAKDYGSSLIKAGFKVVTDAPKAGDVAIYGAIDKHPHGHMQVYTGSKWLSDFKQTDQYPGPDYRNAKAKYTLYRLG